MSTMGLKMPPLIDAMRSMTASSSAFGTCSLGDIAAIWSAVWPKTKRFSSPTCSRISMFAPSSVPMITAPLRTAFMHPVPEASVPAVEICSESSVAGNSTSAAETL
jgi:hypothetical protein